LAMLPKLIILSFSALTVGCSAPIASAISCCVWQASHTEEEIEEAVGISHGTVVDVIAKPSEIATWQNLTVLSQYQEPGCTPPLYNVWKQQDKSNDVGHFGNSEASFTDRLLYLYTEPFDIVVDPFAGGGATIDVCKRRLRRYWASDRFADCHPPGHVRCHNPIVSHVVNPPQRPRAPGPPQVRRRRVAGMLTPFRCWRRSTAPYVARRCAWLCMLVARCPRWPAGRHVPPVGVPLSTGHEVPARPRRIHRSRCWVVAPGHPAQAPPAPVPASWS